MKTQWSAVIGVLCLSFGLVAQQPVKPDPQPAKVKAKVQVKLTEDARRAFAQAAVMRKSMKGKRGPERLVVLQKLAEYCAGIAQKFSAERAAVTRAWFESAEAWRRHGSPDKAAANYGKALDHDDGRYRERGLFQLAQMQRRLKQPAVAIETYRKAAEVKPTSKRAHDARVWVARCLDMLAKPEEALVAYREARDSARNTRQVIDADNWLAKALIKRGDLDGAQAAIDHAEGVAKREAGEAAVKLGEKARQMSARRALQRARDKANGAAQDAADLEAARRRK